jgi:hypothetical protein
MKIMEGLVKDRLAYCDNCKTMRAFFEGNIPAVEGATDQRPGADYVCATCYTIIATFETVTPEEFRTAAQDIDDPDLNAIHGT